MVETDTSAATGNCTALVEKVATRFRKAGFPEAQLTVFRDEDPEPNEGLVLILPGTSAKAKPMLLLGHLDVANTRRQYWKTDPFKLVEQDGYFFGRGVADMKSLDAIWVDTLLRFRDEGFRPKRTIKLALTCGHESSAQTNGVEWLTTHRPELIAAEFALAEGGGGDSDGHSKTLSQSISVGEMTMANFDIEAFTSGGPSAIPNYDNAISRIVNAIQKVHAFRFPVHLDPTSRSYLAQVGAARGDALGAAMIRLAADPTDNTAEAVVSSNNLYNAVIRTTCLTTLMQGGYIATSIPQTAKATVNCYIVPGETVEQTRTALYNAIGNPDLVMTRVGRAPPTPVMPPLEPHILRPAEKLVARHFPGVKLIPDVSLYATDGAYLGPLGIPTYGVPGLVNDPDGNAVGGRNERMAVESVYAARDFLYDLVKAYALQE